jgi:hypothetical protein
MNLPISQDRFNRSKKNITGRGERSKIHNFPLSKRETPSPFRKTIMEYFIVKTRDDQEKKTPGTNQTAK